jgi:hypothetical protein
MFKNLRWYLSKRTIFYIIPIFALFYYLSSRRKILFKGKQREITINTSALLWNPSTDLKNPTFAFKESAILFIKKLLKENWKLSLINIVKSDQQQQSIELLLLDSGLYKLGLQTQRVLFCNTNEGLVTISRHIAAQIHLDTNEDNTRELSQFIKKCVLLKPKGDLTLSASLKNVDRVHTLTNIVL